MKAYHIIGIDSADLFRLRDQRITEDEIVQKARALFECVTESGMLTAVQPTPEHSRQFHLDRLVGDDQYVYLSLGKRYWNEPERVNFGFVFDVERLLRDGAILRTQDLLSAYGDLLDEVVRRYVPDQRETEFSEDEVARLMAALEDPESDYVSPNDAYYTLLDAVEHQNLDVPQTQEATARFIQEARRLQQRFQSVGEDAVRLAHQEGETGTFEILVKGQLPLTSCIGIVYEGREHVQSIKS